MSNLFLNEGATMERITRQAKLARLAGSFALHLARKANDPLYMKAIKAKKIFLLAKKKIIMKYGMRGQAAARQALSGH